MRANWPSVRCVISNGCSRGRFILLRGTVARIVPTRLLSISYRLGLGSSGLDYSLTDNHGLSLTCRLFFLFLFLKLHPAAHRLPSSFSFTRCCNCRIGRWFATRYLSLFGHSHWTDSHPTRVLRLRAQPGGCIGKQPIRSSSRRCRLCLRLLGRPANTFSGACLCALLNGSLQLNRRPPPLHQRHCGPSQLAASHGRSLGHFTQWCR